MNLNQYAKNKNISYSKAWRQFSNGEIPNSEKINGIININEPPNVALASIQDKEPFVYGIDTEQGKRVRVAKADDNTSGSRRNRATTIIPTDRFANIESGMLPYKYVSDSAGNTSLITAREAIILVTKSYFNYAEIRSMVDFLSSSCVGEIYFKKGNKKGRDFFTAWWNKMTPLNLQEQFYREFFRSGNCFIYRQDGTIKQDDISLLTTTYGISTAAQTLKLPIKYILLNPADIALQTSSAFINGVYFKLISDYELEALKNPRNDIDKEVFENLPPQTKELIQKKNYKNAIYIPLNSKLITYIAYKKSDYEAFGISMLFSILDDLEFYSELRKGDAAINRTLQQAVLLITMGSEPEKGGINPKAMDAMAKLFENQSTARVVVSTYDTKMQFLIPEIADILDPKKYEVVKERIQSGLSNILTGSAEKFANRSISLNLFIQQIRNTRRIFIENFLKPEVRRIAQDLGFRDFPEPQYEDLNLKDELEFSRLFIRMGETGVLTPAEVLEALETGKLPGPEESIENQTQLRQMKDKGLYAPLAGGPYDQLKIAKVKGTMATPFGKPAGPNGRPNGTPQPKFTKKVSPIKASTDDLETTDDISEQLYDFKKIKDNLILASKLENNVCDALLKKFKIKKLNETQQEIAAQISELVMSNESPEAWLSAVAHFIENPQDKENKNERMGELEEIKYNHQIGNYLGCILLNSKISAAPKNDKKG